MNKFLIINPFGIGDVLFTTPVISAIKTAIPGAYIGYWCNQRISPLLDYVPQVNQAFPLSRGDIKKIYAESPWQGVRACLLLASRIRRAGFAIALDFSLDSRYTLAAKMLGIRRRAGFNFKGRGRMLTDKIVLEHGYRAKHVVDYYLELLKFIDIIPKKRELFLFVPEKDSLSARQLIRRQEPQADPGLRIGLAPGAGASWGKDASLKHWPAIKYAQLADMLADNFKAGIVLLGDSSEQPLADVITGAMRNRPVDLVGKTSLKELAAAINNLDILIANDGGPLHIAVALGKKTVSIFGPVDEVTYGPYPPSEKQVVVRKELSCRPCYRDFRMDPCGNNRECLGLISVEEVFAAVRSLL